MEKLLFQSAKALATAIRNKQVSSTEIVTSSISRIEIVNPKINAIVQKTFEYALDQARRADDALMSDDIWGPLHGIPMTIKDSLDTSGVITTAGTKGRAAYVPKKDATVVARLRAAGAILLGKTNTPELTLTGITDNYVYGRTNNPYDLTRKPGGSSGGAAAIIASGAVPFDIGSDTGGSIRLPSHYCGIAGIKPTAGRVPRTGHIISFDIGFLDSLTHIGPLARYVEDLVMLLPIISGPDWYDPTIALATLGNPLDVPLSKLRVAYYTDNGIVAPTPDTKQTVHQCVEALSACGIPCTEACPPEMTEADRLFGSLLLADGGAAVRKIMQSCGTDLNDMHATIRWTQSDHMMTTLELADLIAQWNICRSQLLTFLENYDAIVCPASSSPATKHDDGDGPDFSYTKLYNFTGWPVVVVRGGTSSEGLPIGVQVVARPWREDVALAVAQQIENAFGGWQQPMIYGT